jgi:type IX secretion system substrate protein
MVQLKIFFVKFTSHLKIIIYIYTGLLNLNVQNPTSMEQPVILPIKIKLFPSSAQNEMHIEAENEMIQQVKVYSALCELVFNENDINRKGNVTINTSTLTKGVYIVRVFTAKTNTI